MKKEVYKRKAFNRTGLNVNNSLEGESIEKKIERALENNEPIKDGAPLIYTERKDGVMAGYNIKTDRFEIALEASDKLSRSKASQRDNLAKMDVVKDEKTGDKPVGGAEPTQATE